MPERLQARTFRSGEWPAGGKSARSRREQVRRRTGRAEGGWTERLRTPAAARGLLIAVVFAAVASVIVIWARERPIAEPGRISPVSRLVRVDFEVEDAAATASRRELARASAPRVYIADQAVFQEIESSLEGLPTALADALTLDKVAAEIREQFGLTQDRLDAVRENVVAGEADQAWGSKVRALMLRMRVTPIIDRATYQIEQQQPAERIELRTWDAPPAQRIKGVLINVEGDQLVPAMRDIVEAAGFRPPVDGLVLERLARAPRATYTHSEGATEEGRDKAELATPAAMVRHSAGRVIVARGQALDKERHALLLAEHQAYWRQASPQQRWAPRAGAVALMALITALGGGYLALYAPRVRRSPMRMLAIAGLLAITLAAACAAGVYNPGRLTLVAIAPVVFAGVVLAVAYDQRSALALTALHALLVTLALNQGPAFFAAAVAGSCVAIWRLRDVRNRESFIYAGLASGAALAIVIGAGAMVEQPVSFALWPQALFDALLGALGGLLVGFVALGVLPAVERAFDVTTGLTLIELRDPKQPLLRELQQRAPGTYSHSLTVATLAETAADAIGADGLHVYVGALYHDIGKMNKPDYFVENQTGAFNRHDKLSPAMSLLVIVGHVKDGVELAKEGNLPRSLHHYIESHHGTTLVEYFFHAARKKADAAEQDEPAEIEYRYSGPKPRTKEAAILMLCDAVEGATRAMSDPTPSRIEALVQDVAMKRLLDGQFDESEITLHELTIIEAAVVKSLCSIYHGRIAYPSGMRDDERRATPPSSRPAPEVEKPAASPQTASRTA